jgi:peptidoglycan/LPS O-acetylase OafA/YrhL
MKHRTPALRLAIVGLVSGAIAALLELALVKVLDAGYIQSRPAFYVAACLPGALVALAYFNSTAKLAASGVSCLLGIVVFYKTAVQTGAVTELGNDRDWVLVLVLNCVTIVVVAAAARALRHRRSTVQAADTGAKHS